MPDEWHHVGSRTDLLARVPFATRVGGSRVALFHYDGAFRAIADACNPKGGPLSEGHCNGVKHKPSHLLDDHPKDPDAPVRVLGISTTAMDAGNPRFSTSDHLLEHALANANANARRHSSSACVNSTSCPARATTRNTPAHARGRARSPSGWAIATV